MTLTLKKKKKLIHYMIKDSMKSVLGTVKKQLHGNVKSWRKIEQISFSDCVLGVSSIQIIKIKFWLKCMFGKDRPITDDYSAQHAQVID